MKKVVRWRDVEEAVETFGRLLGSDLGVVRAMNMGLAPFRGTNRRFVLDDAGDVFDGVELLVDDEEKIESVIIHITDRDGNLAARVRGLGTPVGFDLVSPPPMTVGEAPRWKSKYSECHIVKGRMVCFGIDEYDDGERLASVVISEAD